MFQRAFRNWIFGLGAVYAALILLLNHFMLSGETRMARLLFYALVVFIPAGLWSAALDLIRIYRGDRRSDLRESLPWLAGLGIAACIWTISAVTR